MKQLTIITCISIVLLLFLSNSLQAQKKLKYKKTKATHQLEFNAILGATVTSYTVFFPDMENEFLGLSLKYCQGLAIGKRLKKIPQIGIYGDVLVKSHLFRKYKEEKLFVTNPTSKYRAANLKFSPHIRYYLGDQKRTSQYIGFGFSHSFILKKTLSNDLGNALGYRFGAEYISVPSRPTEQGAFLMLGSTWDCFSLALRLEVGNGFTDPDFFRSQSSVAYLLFTYNFKKREKPDKV